jgi:hypothetical protein
MAAGFLYLIAALNVVVLAGILKVFRGLRAGLFDEAELERQRLNCRDARSRESAGHRPLGFPARGQGCGRAC